jgi:large-conductance mechanosensitive channel
VNGNIKSKTSTVSINNKEENINIENNTQVENENISDKIVEENENDDILEVLISNVESKSENDLTNKNDEEITKIGIKFDYSIILYIIFILLIVATIIFILIRLKNKT